MKPQDFYGLKIGLIVYWNGQEQVIRHLSKEDSEYFNGWIMTKCQINTVKFFNVDKNLNWDAICDECSLEAPKQKTKVTLYRHWLRTTCGDIICLQSTRKHYIDAGDGRTLLESEIVTTKEFDI